MAVRRAGRSAVGTGGFGALADLARRRARGRRGAEIRRGRDRRRGAGLRLAVLRQRQEAGQGVAAFAGAGDRAGRVPELSARTSNARAASPRRSRQALPTSRHPVDRAGRTGGGRAALFAKRDAGVSARKRRLCRSIRISATCSETAAPALLGRFPLHRAPADVAAAEAVRPVDPVDRRIGRRLRLGDGRCPCAVTLSTRPPLATSSPSLQRRAGMEDLRRRRRVGRLEAADRRPPFAARRDSRSPPSRRSAPRRRASAPTCARAGRRPRR